MRRVDTGNSSDSSDEELKSITERLKDSINLKPKPLTDSFMLQSKIKEAQQKSVDIQLAWQNGRQLRVYQETLVDQSGAVFKKSQSSQQLKEFIFNEHIEPQRYFSPHH